jgi:hypothetical protein
MKIELGKYKHSKSGKEYEVIGIAHHSETLEELIVYKALYHSQEFGINAIWVRPIKMWNELVEINGEKLPRFQKI